MDFVENDMSSKDSVMGYEHFIDLICDIGISKRQRCGF